jgi:hypothetical protein
MPTGGRTSLQGFRVIGGKAERVVPEEGRRELVTAYVWRHLPAGSTLVYTWGDPRAFTVTGPGLPPDPHSLRAVFGEDVANQLPALPLREVSGMWKRHVSGLAMLAYGDASALSARVRP